MHRLIAVILSKEVKVTKDDTELEKLVKPLLAPHEEKENPKDPDGEYSGRWDYWSVGGRWDDFYGFGTNCFKAKRILLKSDFPQHFIDPDGVWHENWDREDLKPYSSHACVLVDCHG